MATKKRDKQMSDQSVTDDDGYILINVPLELPTLKPENLKIPKDAVTLLDECYRKYLLRTNKPVPYTREVYLGWMFAKLFIMFIDKKSNELSLAEKSGIGTEFLD